MVSGQACIEINENEYIKDYFSCADKEYLKEITPTDMKYGYVYKYYKFLIFKYLIKPEEKPLAQKLARNLLIDLLDEKHYYAGSYKPTPIITSDYEHGLKVDYYTYLINSKCIDEKLEFLKPETIEYFARKMAITRYNKLAENRDLLRTLEKEDLINMMFMDLNVQKFINNEVQTIIKSTNKNKRRRVSKSTDKNKRRRTSKTVRKVKQRRTSKTDKKITLNKDFVKSIITEIPEN